MMGLKMHKQIKATASLINAPGRPSYNWGVIGVKFKLMVHDDISIGIGPLMINLILEQNCANNYIFR